MIDAVPPIRHGVSGVQQRPGALPADKGDEFPRFRRAPRRPAIPPRIARRGFARYRPSLVRHGRRADIFRPSPTSLTRRHLGQRFC